jgi:predicted metal-binding membrane protein
MNSENRLQVVVALIFLAAAGMTAAFVASMAGGMTMPGGWKMSMMWMVMPGQTWPMAALMFVAMWVAMMVAMMLPSTWPLLSLYQRIMRFRGERRVGWLTAWLGLGYLSAWLGFGILAYAIGLAVGGAAMASEAVSRLVPTGGGLMFVLAGIYQLTPWKTTCLMRCRNPVSVLSQHLSSSWRTALRLGALHGGFCVGCCWGLMLIQIVLGIMSLAAMVLVAGIIAAEKLLPQGELIARISGAAAIVAGMATMATALQQV